jgi:hypothetical protein
MWTLRLLFCTYLEETDEGESWSIHSLWILTIHSDDVAASYPSVLPIEQS